MNETKHLPSLDGWRAVAILLVLGSHWVFTNGMPPYYGSRLPRLFDAILGVQFFFTISGFLITWLLLKEESEFGAISLKSFYARRALRILPVYLSCLAVLALLQALKVCSQKPIVWFQLLTFTRNFYQGGHAESLSSVHFWSLSVEEQFYFVWPFVLAFLAVSQRQRFYFPAVAILVSIVWKIIALLGCYNRHLYFLFEENSTFLFLDCIAYGCAGAILLKTRGADLKAFFDKFSMPLFLVCCFLIVLPEIAGWGKGLQNFGFIFLLLQSVLSPDFAPFKILNHSWMVRIGILSYSIYIWQQVVFVTWPFPGWWFLSFPAVFLAGWLSYELLEKPFFSLRSKFRPEKFVKM